VNTSLPARFVDAFLKSFTRAFREDLSGHLLLGLATVVYEIFLRKSNYPGEIVIPIIWFFAVEAAWHAYKAWRFLDKEIVSNSSKSTVTLSQRGQPIELPVMNATTERLKAGVIALCAVALCIGIAVVCPKVLSENPVTAFDIVEPLVGQAEKTDLPAAMLYTPRLELSPLIVGRPMVLTPYCENGGPETAFEAVQISDAVVVDVDDATKPGDISASKTDFVYKSWPHPHGLGVSTIPKGKCVHVWVIGDTLTKELKNQLDNGTRVVVWVGFSAWRDKRGTFKYEQCYWRNPDGSWAICQNHNGLNPLAGSSSEQQPTTLENVEANIQTWSTDMGLTVTDVSSRYPESLFAIHLVSSNGTSIVVEHPKERDRFLLFDADLEITDSEQKRAFLNLSEERRQDLLRNVMIEMNKLSIGCMTRPTLTRTVDLQKAVLISGLTDDSFLNEMQGLNSAIALAGEVIQRGLEHPSAK